jgi:hypothetical protein
MEDGTIETHLSVRSRTYEVKIDEKVLLLFHCPQCGRDFARGADESVWRAVRIGTFRVDFLADQQSVSQPCPGVPSPSQDSIFSAANPATSGSISAATDSVSADPSSGGTSRGRPRKLTKQ